MRTASLAAGVTAGLTAAAMIATPLATKGDATRRTLSNVVVAGLAGTTKAAVARRWGWGRAAMAASVVMTATGAIEHLGTSTGVPFGHYRYTGRLRPTITGVPLAVPLAWWAMAVPAREVAHAALGSSSSRWARIGLGSVALTAWDLFLDPQMTAEGYWRWRRQGVYRGIPWTNFAGWLVTGAAVMAALEALLPVQRPDRVLVAEYGAMAVMETLGFAAFFRDPVVAVTGGLGMLPVAAAGALRVARG